MSNEASTMEITMPMYFRIFAAVQAMKIHVESNGSMMLTRTATPARLRAIATEFTGRPYPRSRKGLVTAHAELTVLRDKLREAFASGVSGQVIDA